MAQSPLYSERLDDALAMVADDFRNIERKGSGVPYLTHLLAVMVSVAEHGGSEDQMIAALLHDTLEDIEGTTAKILAERFGAIVADYVVALSDTVVRPKPPWKERKTAYIERLAAKPSEVKLISAADKLHNVSSIVRDFQAIGDAIFDRFTASKDETLWYYREIAKALRTKWHHPITDVLNAQVAELHRIADR